MHTSTMANTEQVLKTIPERVDCGTFNVGEIKESVVTLTNIGKVVFQIDKIKADCSCVKTTVSTKKIFSGAKAELRIAILRRNEGRFSYTVLIIPEDKEKYAPIAIQLVGNTVQLVSAKIGWKDSVLKKLGPDGLTKLELVHRLSANPIIYLTAKDKRFNLRKSLIEVNSKNFELEEYRFEKLSSEGQILTASGKKDLLVLKLKPRVALKIGTLRDLIEIGLANDVRLYIPMESRIVGDIYGETRIIHMGTLGDNAPQPFTICFTNNTAKWTDLKWRVVGLLSDALKINPNKNNSSDSSINLTLSIDQSKLSNLHRGYVFCRIKLYQNELIDNGAVSVLVDGFN